ncbi:FtsX-like permease family protein [Lysobacter pythonis]|uniref:FtsX-like permease family protein n=1 Tax=Solilutibacter pythonis TaxID=2483112 RepID=A0A3M2HX49_9GAMM|nr:ABC transporter permease [Lysobacter pythonis]RMH92845.1 FtsX-like permease family protein [Lysobacter pythonis]
MFGYYLKLALKSLKRNKALTVLMVLTIAVGIGATMTTLTVFRTLAGDPIPDKSERLFRVQLDMYPGTAKKTNSEPPADLSRYDAETLLAARRAKAQAITVASTIVIEAGAAAQPFIATARNASADFFPMFQVPMKHGKPWSRADDDARARVAVITPELNDKLFGGADATGKTVRLEDTEFRIVGVMDEWRPTPRFYDNNASTFGKTEMVFVPYATARELEWGNSGSMNCFSASRQGKDTDLNQPCVWLQYWVELESPARAAEFKRYLENYSGQQKAAGRFARPPNVRLRNVMAWLDFTKAVPSDVKLQLWLSLGFLIVCLVNVVGLLLAKFLRRSGEIGVRRALGASRGQIFMQLLIEAALVGLAGGVAGLALAFLGLWGVRQQPAQYAELASMNLPMLASTFAVALLASLLAGALPAWRAMRIAPAIQLKTQ